MASPLLRQGSSPDKQNETPLVKSLVLAGGRRTRRIEVHDWNAVGLAIGLVAAAVDLVRRDRTAENGVQFFLVRDLRDLDEIGLCLGHRQPPLCWVDRGSVAHKKNPPAPQSAGGSVVFRPRQRPNHVKDASVSPR